MRLVETGARQIDHPRRNPLNAPRHKGWSHFIPAPKSCDTLLPYLINEAS